MCFLNTLGFYEYLSPGTPIPNCLISISVKGYLIGLAHFGRPDDMGLANIWGQVPTCGLAAWLQ